MSETNDFKNKKPRNYYVDYSKRGTRGRGPGAGNTSNNSRFKDTPELGYGNKGFFITSIDEVKSYLEMRNLLETYVELLYKKTANTNDDVERLGSACDDELEAELSQLRNSRPLKQVKTHCRNSLFINITRDHKHINPLEVVDKIFEDFEKERVLKTSNTFKLVPILDTFRTNVSCAKESISNLLHSMFNDETKPLKFFIEFQSRGNFKLNPEDKQKMIEGIAETVSQLKPEWSVNREEADVMIILVALRSVCCISLLRHYFKRSKYNIEEFCKDFKTTTEETNLSS